MLDVEFARTRWIRGFRSRNKAAVGEPAAGSLHFNSSDIITVFYYINIHVLLKNNMCCEFINWSE